MIRLENVSVSFRGGAHALRNVSVRLGEHPMTVLLGPSGAGKSTLLRCANGLISPTQGSVRDARGRDIGESRNVLTAHRRDIAMVFQQHHLVGRVSALQNVVNGRLGRLARWHALLPPPEADRVVALAQLDRVGLIDKAFVRAEKLSGGEQQRVGIARALAQEPSLILADEPVASLDPATACDILGLIRDLTREAQTRQGRSIEAVVSLHQVDLAVRFADWIVGVNDGRIVFEGPPTALDSGALQLIYGQSAPQRADDLAYAAE